MPSRQARRKRQAAELYYRYMDEGVYSHDSHARELDIEPAPLEKRRAPQEPRKRKKEKTVAVKRTTVKQKKRRGTQIEYIINYVPTEKMPISFVLLLCLLVAGVGINLLFFAYNSQQEVALQKINKQIGITKENIIHKNAEAVTSIDLEAVSLVAQTKLFMGLPKDYQVVHIEVPNESYFTQTAEKIEKPGILSSIQSFFLTGE